MAAQVPNPQTSESVSTRQVDEVIGKMEDLYRSVTGTNPPPGEGYAPIPVEKDPERHVQEQLDRLLGLLGSVGIPSEAARPPFHPPLAVVETERELVVRVDLPGVAREDVKVIARENELTVSGVRKAEGGPDRRVRFGESPRGPFVRKVLLPPNLRAGEPQASLKDGVLEVRFARPTPEESAPRSVRVQ